MIYAHDLFYEFSVHDYETVKPIHNQLHPSLIERKPSDVERPFQSDGDRIVRRHFREQPTNCASSISPADIEAHRMSR
jgi:hypothetical protein